MKSKKSSKPKTRPVFHEITVDVMGQPYTMLRVTLNDGSQWDTDMMTMVAADNRGLVMRKPVDG